MLFNTVQFFVFLALVLPVFFALRRSAWQNIFLLAVSYYFYMCWSTSYIWVIWLITVLDYVAGLRIEQARTPGSRRAFLGLSIAANFGLLFTFKYLGFFSSALQVAAQTFGQSFQLPVLQVALPVGISFHTFQAVSYTVEVYRRRVPAERNFIRYALYVAFFPQMVAGPIERPYNLLPQLNWGKSPSLERFKSGLRLTLWGLFKKAVIADLLQAAVTTVYSEPRRFSGPLLILATFFFAIQVYCDFSGYSDMAIGIARIMGYDLMINFRQPYFARSTAEFWHRWHISLSTWFRDYLYIPLGGSRVPPGRWFTNLFIVFVISGLWHGANWTFVCWGALHGSFLLIGLTTASPRATVRRALRLSDHPRLLISIQTGITFLLVSSAWVFFRAASVSDALYILRNMASLQNFKIPDLFAMGLPRFELCSAFVFVGILFLVDGCTAYRPRRMTLIWNRSGVLRWASYYGCAFGIICFGVFARLEFIYFQF